MIARGILKIQNLPWVNADCTPERLNEGGAPRYAAHRGEVKISHY